MKHPLRSLLSALAVSLTAALPGTRADAVTASVVPADTSVCEHETFVVRIVTDAFADLKGFELIFSFDATKIALLGVDPGDVLTTSGDPFSAFVLPDHAAPVDTAWYDAAVLVGSTSGPGILAFFRFVALQPGDSPIQCRLVDFRDSNNVQTLPDCVSGLVRVTAATPARPASWGRLKSLYR